MSLTNKSVSAINLSQLNINSFNNEYLMRYHDVIVNTGRMV